MRIARQPIYDRHLRIAGFELFFRDGTSNSYPDIDPHDATSRMVLEGGLTLGLATITDGLPAFVNCSHQSLMAGLPKLLPAHLTVVEILEDIQPDREVLEACRELRRLGYRIALDDFVYSPQLAPLLALADMVKLEIPSTSPEERRALLDHYSLEFVAEKVETPEDLRASRAEGFHFFQGYHFGRPEIMERLLQDAPHLSLLVGAHVCGSKTDPRYVCQLIQLDPSLERSLRFFAYEAGYDSSAPVEPLFASLSPEDQRRWGRKLLALGATARRDRAA